MPDTANDVSVHFAALRAPLYAYLRKYLRDPAAAEDLLQQVFLKALMAINDQQSIRNLPGWLYKVARTSAIDHHRADQGLCTSLRDDVAMEEGDDSSLQQELSLCLKPLAHLLPAIYRDTLIAADLEGQSLRGIADAAGLSESAIKSRASRARKLLKTKLLECCELEVSNGVLDGCRRKSRGCSTQCC